MPRQPSLVVVASFVQMQFQHELCLREKEFPGPRNEEPKGPWIRVCELEPRSCFGSFSPVHNDTSDPERVMNSLRGFNGGSATDRFDFGSSSSLSVPWDSFLARYSRLDRFDLFVGEADVFAPAGQGAFGDGKEVHDLAVGPTGPAKAAP